MKVKAGEEPEAKPRLKEINRRQLLLRPVDVEGLVAEEHPVRGIWELAGQLDLSRFYEAIEAVEGGAGRSATDPRLLISLWIYAYSEGVGSAREIERLCGYHPAYQWLTGTEVVNHHTLSDFRVDHKEALDELFAQVLGVLSAEGLITLERVMHDGTKVRANAGADTFRREERMRAWLEVARKQVEEMGDPRGEEQSQRVAKARQRAVRERKQRLEQALEELEKVRAAKPEAEDKQRARASVTDPQARVMKQADGGYAPSYNVQISTDAAAGAIVGVGATQAGSDYRELEDGVERVEENLGSAPEQLVADGGFTSRENILAMDERGIDFIGSLEERNAQSAGQMDRRGVAPEFRLDAFVYEAASDTYTCPAGKTLRHESKQKRIGKTVAMRVVGIESYVKDHPLERHLRDAVCFPLYDGGNMGVRRRQLHEILRTPGYDSMIVAEDRELAVNAGYGGQKGLSPKERSSGITAKSSRRSTGKL